MIKNNKPLIFIFAIIPFASFAADGPAVQSTNFEAGGSYNSSSVFNTYSLNAGVNLPISNGFGTNIGIRLADSDGRRHGNTRGVDSTHQALAASIFFRKVDSVKAGIRYAHSRSEYDALISGDDTVNSDNYAIFGEYYIKQFTVAASRSYTSDDDNFEAYSTQLMTSWYLLENNMIGLMQSRYKGENSYLANITYQPSFMKNNLSFSLQYYSSRIGGTGDSIAVSLNYYFGTRVSLIDRDRRYR